MFLNVSLHPHRPPAGQKPVLYVQYLVPVEVPTGSLMQWAYGLSRMAPMAAQNRTVDRYLPMWKALHTAPNRRPAELLAKTKAERAMSCRA